MQSPDFLQKSYMAHLGREYSTEIMAYLLQAENKSVSLARVKGDRRACLINWLMKINIP